MYIKIILLLESLKHKYRSRYKLVRAFDSYKYRIICFFENVAVRMLPLSKCQLNKDNNGTIIVVSLTSFPARINSCFYTIKSIFAQTMRPDRIVLWLAESQFPNKQLPKPFNKLIQKGLEIRFCDDLRSHKKYFYMLQEQKINELIVTFDDDIIYHPKSIERAYKKHLAYPQAIVCNEVKYIQIDNDGKAIKSYRDWGHPQDEEKTPDLRYSVMSGSGTLYPYGIFPQEMFDWDKIKKVAYTADDLWITFMAKYYNIPIVGTDTGARVYTTVSNSQRISLGQINCESGGNDDSVNMILKEYPSIKKLFLSE